MKSLFTKREQLAAIHARGNAAAAYLLKKREAIIGKPMPCLYTPKDIKLSDFEFVRVETNENGTCRKPGDWIKYSGHTKCPDWDNCETIYLITLPCGCLFDFCHRASNCALPNDRQHRCWKMNGTWPNVTLSAGCGNYCSILHYCHKGPNWHGLLINGHLVECLP